MEDRVYDKLDFNIWGRAVEFMKPFQKRFLRIVAVIIPFGITEATFPILAKYAIDNFVERNTIDGLGKFALFYALFILLTLGLFRLYIMFTARLQCDLQYTIRKRAFENLQRLSLSYYDNRAVGWLMSRMTSDVSNLTEAICWGLLDLGFGVSMMLAYMIFMLKLNVRLALWAFLVLPVIGIISFYFHKVMIRIQRKIKAVNSEITAAYNEDIQGAKTTKTLVREELNFKDFKYLTSDYRRKSLRSVSISSVFMPSIIVLGSVGTSVVLVKGGYDVMAGTLSVGTLAAFISYTLQFYEPMRQIGAIFSDLLSAQASAERVLSLMYEKPEIIDRKEVIAKYGDSIDTHPETWPKISGNVEFKAVDFYYNEKEPILKNFNLSVKAGETIALVGETGSGKSTIVNLFSRFYEPVSGSIAIDGIDYRELPQAWIHSNLGYVLQSPHLFSGSIRENIRYGNPEATEEEIIAACKMVNAHDFIMKTEKGYDSEVGEGGGLLSTGQKQLISFARAIVRNPRLFVLDEATSSVDTETEKMIQDAVHRVLNGRTSFVVAHRLSTIRNADKILVINKGLIEEMGTHEELIRKKGHYYHLYVSQFIEERNLLKA